MEVYLDNASTTFPKPKIVIDSIYNYLTNIGGNANRSIYSNSLESSRQLLIAREKIATLFNFDKSENVIFTNNVTTSLNYLIRGIAKPGNHIITSSMEHNSVLRPLTDCKNKLNIELDIIQGDNKGFININDIKKLVKTNTKAIIISHASNVTGSIQNIKSIGSFCNDSNILFIVDSAQSAGVLDIDMKKIKANAIAFTGHKSILGPQGIGGFIIDDKCNTLCDSIISGGTGSLSHSLDQPTFLPDKFESGTMNMPGIIGLSNAIDYINTIGLNNIKEQNKNLRNYLINGLMNIEGINVYGDLTSNNATTCVSFNYKDIDPSEVAFFLDENGIKSRAGLHCAPLAHKSIHTFPKGTVRLSISHFTTKEELDYTLSIINKINTFLL